jgi:hypothetical protein
MKQKKKLKGSWKFMKIKTGHNGTFGTQKRQS